MKGRPGHAEYWYYDPEMGTSVPLPARSDLDPRWEWVEIRVPESTKSRYVRGGCKHLDTVPVESVRGAVVARLCLTCDSQLPALA